MLNLAQLASKKHFCLNQLRPLHHKVVSRPQTIYALSTSPGKAGVAVIRISGNNAKEVFSSDQVALLSLR